MSDLDRYITDEVMAAFHRWDCFDADTHEDCRDVIRATLPAIRAEVLREAASELTLYRPGKFAEAAEILDGWADEAVTP